MRTTTLSALNSGANRGRGAWFLLGAGLGTGGSLAWAGIDGAFLLLVLVGLGGSALIQRRVPGRFASVAGLLAAFDAFVLSLWISPPCDPDTYRPVEAPGDTFRLACDPQEGMGVLALWALAAS